MGTIEVNIEKWALDTTWKEPEHSLWLELNFVVVVVRTYLIDPSPLITVPD